MPRFARPLRARHLPWLPVLLGVLACATPRPREVPLEKWSPSENELAAAQVEGDRAPELLVLLAFSGGGTRAAAFAYGVLQELAATEVGTSQGRRPLQKEVDVISSVSGGSFTSSYFALKGDGIFEDFEERFLRKNIEGALIARVLNPFNWWKLASPTYGKSDLAAAYYSKHIFDGATFADLRRPDAPALIVNATDLGSGLRFSFYRELFDLLCSDIDPFPLSRAVAASSAVPGLLSPIALENHAGTCGYEMNEWLAQRVAETANSQRQGVEARHAHSLMRYRDREERPWLHLVDGGIADNLGLRSFWMKVSFAGGLDAAFPAPKSTGRQVLLVLVNSIVLKHPEWAGYERSPSLIETVGAVSSVELARYDVDTVELIRTSFRGWADEVSTPSRPVTFHFADVKFESAKDPKEREYLNSLGTNFHLKDEPIDRLIAAGRELLRQSDGFQSFLETNRKRFPEASAAN